MTMITTIADEALYNNALTSVMLLDGLPSADIEVSLQEMDSPRLVRVIIAAIDKKCYKICEAISSELKKRGMHKLQQF